MDDKKIAFFATSCIKKKRYKSKQIAQEAINRVHKKRNTKLRIYYCPFCLGWHLTSKAIYKSKVITNDKETN